MIVGRIACRGAVEERREPILPSRDGGRAADLMEVSRVDPQIGTGDRLNYRDTDLSTKFVAKQSVSPDASVIVEGLTDEEAVYRGADRSDLARGRDD